MGANSSYKAMYDIGQMLKTPIAENAIRDEQLYRQVVEHRRTFIGLRGLKIAQMMSALRILIFHKFHINKKK